MNERDRFRRLFRGEGVDRPPLLEEGIRDEVIERWRAQGMPAGKTHLEIFGLTPHENIGPDIRYATSYFGRIVNLEERDYRRAFQASPDRFPKDWPATVERLSTRDHIVCVWASRGFFQALGVGDWPTLEQALLGAAREPAKIRKRLEIYGDFCARMLELTLNEVDPELILLSEPISDNNAPLISPAMFAEYMIPAYEKVIAVAREHGCSQILVSTYGNSAMLFPCMIGAGVNTLWISEAAELPELDYRSLRLQYGPEIGLVGGIPLSLLRSETPEGLERRLDGLVVPLLRSGRYVPLAGGRVREEIPWAAYRRYRECLAEIMSRPSSEQQ